MKKAIPYCLLFILGCQSEETSIDCSASDLNFEVAQIVDASCGQADGSVSLIATGGTPPYVFSLNRTLTSSTGTFVSIPQGIYDVGVADVNNCRIIKTGLVINPTGIVSFSQTIAPILSSNCTLSGCHVPEDGSSRQDLTDFTIVQQLAQEIKTRTQNGEMPKEGSITQSQIDLIACWVDNGALDN